MRVLAALLLALLSACGDGGTGPSGSHAVLTLGPFPAGVTGKVAFASSINVTASSRAYVETKVHVVDVTTATERVIFTGEDVQVATLTWHPDGTHLVMQSFRFELPGPNGENRDVLQLHRLNVEGTEDEVILDGPGPEFHPAYSRDGRLAYFGRWSDDPEAGIHIDGTPVYHETCSDGNSHIAWSPAGDALTFTCSGFGLQRMLLADGSVSQLLAPENGEAFASLAFAPNGSRIALMRFAGDRQGQEIWTVAPDGQDALRLTSGWNDDFPQWTPAGNYVAFVRYEGASRGIYLMAPDGGTPVRVIRATTSLGTMAWSQ